MAERGRHEQRVNPRPAGNQNMHILRSIGYADVIRFTDFREPALTSVTQTLHAAFRKPAQWNSRALKYRTLNCFLVNAIPVKRGGMFRTEHEHRTGRKDNVVVAERSHRSDEMIKNFLASLAAITEDIMRS